MGLRFRPKIFPKLKLSPLFSMNIQDNGLPLETLKNPLYFRLNFMFYLYCLPSPNIYITRCPPNFYFLVLPLIKDNIDDTKNISTMQQSLVSIFFWNKIACVCRYMYVYMYGPNYPSHPRTWATHFKRGCTSHFLQFDPHMHWS